MAGSRQWTTRDKLLRKIGQFDVHITEAFDRLACFETALRDRPQDKDMYDFIIRMMNTLTVTSTAWGYFETRFKSGHWPPEIIGVNPAAAGQPPLHGMSKAPVPEPTP